MVAELNIRSVISRLAPQGVGAGALRKKTALFFFILFFVLAPFYASACTITPGTNLNFGDYASNQSLPLDGSGSVIVNCADTLPFAVELSSGGVQMIYLANILNYALYRDAGRTLPWGTQISGNAFAGTGNGLNQELYFYGRVPGYQNVPIGPYSDTLSVTVIW